MVHFRNLKDLYLTLSDVNSPLDVRLFKNLGIDHFIIDMKFIQNTFDCLLVMISEKGIVFLFDSMFLKGVKIEIP
jgi:hypothetical protein